MAMKLFHVSLFYAALFTTFSAQGAPPAGSPPPSSQPNGQIPDKPTNAASAAFSRLRFAPMWMPVSKFPPDPNAEPAMPVPSAAYAMIWQPEWQKEIEVSAEQMETLRAINAKALSDAEQHSEHFKSLPPDERTAEVKSWGGSPSPWRQQLDNEIRKQIEAVLTPRQMQTLKEHSFPSHAIGLLYDAKVRREIGFSPEQEGRFRRVIKARLTRFQEEYLGRAENVWGLLSPQQQAELPEVVKYQGPTSAVLSIAYDLGFDMEAMGLSYPMLAETPVRERLGLNAEQDEQLQAVMADVAARSRKFLQEAPKLRPDADEKKRLHDILTKQRLDAILTPPQLTLLKEINFRREVVLALSYKKKRETIGMTNQQIADLQRIDKETHGQLYRIDREMLGKALAILTPSQREQLSVEIDRRLGG